MYTYRILAAALACLVAASAQAATIVGPTPYLDITDTPDGVFHDGATVCVQDFEDADGPWEIGFSIDVGQRIGPKFISGDGVPVTDSVDADDNAIDGDGTMGSSWFAPTRHLMITFDEETTAAAFAFTDADVLAMHDVLGKLEAESVELAMLVRFRYFVGLTLDQVADLTGDSLSTLKRRWTFAKAWLHDQLK